MAEEHSQLVRLRWYGEKFPPKDLYVEVNMQSNTWFPPTHSDCSFSVCSCMHTSVELISTDHFAEAVSYWWQRKTHYEAHLSSAVSEKERFVIPSRDLGSLLKYRCAGLRMDIYLP